MEDINTLPEKAEGDAPNLINADRPSPPLQLSEVEQQILDQYSRLLELQLETSLLRAQETLHDDLPKNITEKELRDAQKALLEAKSLYELRNTMIESVLIANPTLRAVHGSADVSPIERDLLPLIQERDALSVSLTEISAKLLSVREQLTRTETERIITVRGNAGLAETLIGLANQASSQKDDIEDAETRQQIDELERSLKVSRQRWRIMKATASGVVVGSGVDWARNRELQELVLDDEAD